MTFLTGKDRTVLGIAAGALLTPAVWEKGLDPRPFLEENDSLGFFQEAGTLLKTGPTGTNLNDFRLLLVD